jgi:hypothetical protein
MQDTKYRSLTQPNRNHRVDKDRPLPNHLSKTLKLHRPETKLPLAGQLSLQAALTPKPRRPR